MNLNTLRTSAMETYIKEFAPNNCEDEWFYFDDIAMNIFEWQGEKPQVNMYKVGERGIDSLELIDAFSLEV